MTEFRATPSCPWPLLSKDIVENQSPSRLEGMTYEKEASFMRSMCELMKKTGARVKLTRSVATAIVFAHRYYAIKSMQQNDRFIMSCACLFLAGKVEDEPRPLEHISTVCFRLRYNNSPDVLKSLKDPDVAHTLRESILTAERALLYALGFQFSIDHPQVFIRDTLDRFSAMPEPVGIFWKGFRGKDATMPLMQNFINDLYKGTKLVLRYDLRLLGATAIHLGLSTINSKLPSASHDLVPMIDGRPWYEVAMMRGNSSGNPDAPVTVTKELLEDIGKEILALYVTRAQDGTVGGASEVKEIVGADGPVTPPLDHFQAATPVGSRGADEISASATLPSLSPSKDGLLLAGAPAAPAEAGSSAQAGAGLPSSLRPDAPEFHPSAEKAAAAASASGASPEAGRAAASAAAPHASSRKRTSDAAELPSEPEQGQPAKSHRSVPAEADGDASVSCPPGVSSTHVPDGLPNGQAAGSTQHGSEAASLEEHAEMRGSGALADQGLAHLEDVSTQEHSTALASGCV